MTLFSVGMVIICLMSRMLYFLMITLIILSAYCVINLGKMTNKGVLFCLLFAVFFYSIYVTVAVSGLPPSFTDLDYASADAILNDNGNGSVIAWWGEGYFYQALSNKSVVLKGYPDEKKMSLYVDAMGSNDSNASINGFKKMCNCDDFYIVISPALIDYHHFENLSDDAFFYELMDNDFSCFSEIEFGHVWHYNCK